MKKIELINLLENLGYNTADLTWQELLKLKSKIKLDNNKLSKKQLDNNKLSKKRAELLPKIKSFINRMKGKYEISQDEIKEMMSLYNAYFKRNDSGNCSVCVARVFNILKKIK
jgi:hypothetical protein